MYGDRITKTIYRIVHQTYRNTTRAGTMMCGLHSHRIHVPIQSCTCISPAVIIGQ